EVQRILQALASEDPTFRADAKITFSRPAYELLPGHELPNLLAASLTASLTPGGASRVTPRMTGASFWTDAAVLGHAGIPTVIFGPGGAGLHSTEEYVVVADVLSCRDALVELALRWC